MPMGTKYELLKDKISSGFSGVMGKISDLRMNVSDTKHSTTSVIVTTILVLIVTYVLWYIYSKATLDSKNCRVMNDLYQDFALIRSIDAKNNEFSHNLRDYYIKTAYNCCSAGSTKNDYVNICALKNCIKQGVRCLDFEIYSVNNTPVISVSSQKSFDIKESYNAVSFDNAMDTISNYAFSGSTCPNPSDPLLIHLRIMSNNKPIYDMMANIIYKKLSRRLLGKDYSYENNNKNLGKTPLVKLINKVIIMVDKSNPLFSDTLLDEYVNIASHSVFMRALRFNDVKYTPDMNELIDFNKKHMSIVLPDVSNSNINPSSTLSLNYGCQMVALSFQNFDSSLEYYNEMFDIAGSAFILKPIELRHIPSTIKDPPKQKKARSYSPKRLKSDYYDFPNM